MAVVKVRVIPCAGRNEIAGMRQDMLKIKVAAAPEAGKANKACINLLSKKTGIPRSRIHIIKGHKSKEKQIEIEGLTELCIDGIRIP